MTLWFRFPSAGDLLDLTRNLNAMDAREIFALRSHSDPDRLAMEIYAILHKAVRAYAIGLDKNPSAKAFLALWPMDESNGLLGAHLFGTSDFSAVAAPIARWVRRKLIPELLAAGVRRVECRALAEHSGARSLIRACGATEEAILPDLGLKGETYVLCAWRRSDYTQGMD